MTDETPAQQTAIPDKVERAEAAVKKMEVLASQLDNKISELKQLQAERILGGGSPAGTTNEVKEETPQEYKNRIMRGGK